MSSISFKYKITAMARESAISRCMVGVDYISENTDNFIGELEGICILSESAKTLLRNVKYNMNAYGSKYSDDIHFVVNLIELTKECKVCKKRNSAISYFAWPKREGGITITEARKWFGKKSNMRVKCNICRRGGGKKKNNT